MNIYNFDTIHNRRGNGALKWDGMAKLLPQYDPYLFEDIIPLWVADMDFQAPTELIDAMKRIAEHGIYGYSNVPTSFKKLVQQWVQSIHDWKIDSDGVLFCNGVCNSVLTTVLALTKPNDEILYFSPIYGHMRHIIVDFHRTPVIYKPDMEGERFKIDIRKIESLISPKTKMLLLCNPHNPGGTFWSKEDLESIANICLERNIIICSNDIHSDLKFSDAQYTPIASLSREISNITVTHLSPSKTFNLGGQKVSHMYIENHQLRKKINAMNISILGTHPFSVFGIEAFKTVYEHGETWYKELIAYLQTNRNFTIEFITSNIPNIRPIKPQGTYLAWLDCRKISTDERTLMDIFVKGAKVLLSNGSFFGEGGTGYMRLNFACPRSSLAEGLTRIGRTVSSL